jgi:hypothetical protein
MLGFITHQIYFNKVIHISYFGPILLPSLDKKKPHRGNDGGISIYITMERLESDKVLINGSRYHKLGLQYKYIKSYKKIKGWKNPTR